MAVMEDGSGTERLDGIIGLLYSGEAELHDDSIGRQIGTLLATSREARSAAPGTLVHVDEADIAYVLTAARRAFLVRPALLRISPPVNLCGDVHGQYYDLLRVLELLGPPPDQRFLFLGDYVDRGAQSVEVIVLLLALHVRFPEHMYLLRGNHESALLNRNYGFYGELERRGYPQSLQKRFADCFNCMPLAAVVGGRIFCCHGGLSPDLRSLDQINYLPRPADVPKSGLFCDLLWADPDYVSGWEPNRARGCSYLFGPEIVDEFLRAHDLDLVCRAHQVVENGYEFFARRGLVTIFSAPNYSRNWCCNAGVVMNVGPDLTCSFVVFKEEKARSDSAQAEQSR